VGYDRKTQPSMHAQGVTTCLYPLSVIKTRQMALAGSPPGLSVRVPIPTLHQLAPMLCLCIDVCLLRPHVQM